MAKISRLGRRCFILFCLGSSSLSAQVVKGRLLEERSVAPIPGADVHIAGTTFHEITDAEGFFSFTGELPQGEQILILSKNAFFSKRYPITITAEDKDLGNLFLEADLPELQQQTAIISLSDQELDEKDGSYSNISGLLQASRDVFLNAAAFDFSPTFFRPRGYDSEWGKVLINGIEMNKMYNGRPLWSQWGGLNDVQRNQVFTMGMTASEATFGGPAGTTNIIMRASQYKQGGKISYAVSNRAYSGRIMASYHTGLSEEGWALSLSLARRYAEESYFDGTLYDADSFFLAVEKKFNEQHSLNLTAFYTPNRRGKNSPNTEEVYDLKGVRYNSYWGYQNGDIRNSRIKNVQEPVLMLNYYYKLSPKAELNTNLAYQFGSTGDSRIDYGGSRLFTGDNGEEIFIGGGSSPDPAYYQKLPSYFLRFENDPDYRSAYLAQEKFLQDGQIDWSAMYLANQTAVTAGGNALYALYEDRNDDRQISANSILNWQVSSRMSLNTSVSYRYLSSENYAHVLDLLGGNVYLDVDSFSEGDAAQNNLLVPNRLVLENDIFKYHYDLDATEAGTFLQAQLYLKKWELYAAAEVSYSQYQRNGFFKNGNFPDNSLGKSDSPDFIAPGIKAGTTYKISGKHLLNVNLATFSEAPTLRNSFSNTRQNNNVVQGLETQKIMTGDLSYIFRSRWLRGRITGFYGRFQNVSEISFYYADGLSGLGRNTTTAFVQEVLTGLDKRNTGIELGVEARLSSTIKLKAAASAGEYIYSNNPRLYLTSDDFSEALQMGKAHLKNYRIAGGPQQVAQLGFDYRDPNYWWFSATANYFARAFVDIAPLMRTSNFFTDSDGLPIVNYDPELAKHLLKQEELDDYVLVNLVGGKSWRIKQKYIGFFASLNNVLGENYRTGGYEQSRNANFLLLKEDREREQPLFSPKYWFGPGTTYYAHLYLRF